MRILIAASLAATIWSSDAFAQSIMDGSDKNLEPGVADKVLKAVVGDFFDPTASQFYSLGYQTKADGTKIKNSICGYVNGKNQLGGYVGIEPFFYDVEKAKATLLPSELRPQAMETFFQFVEAMGCPRPYK